MNTITNRRHTARRIFVLGSLAAAAVAIAPGAASAGCSGQTIQATSNNQVIHGTGCDDTIKIGRYANVTVYAGGGNDYISAGFNGNGGTSYIYGEAGNDTVNNMGFKQVWVDGGSGNDTLEGSDQADTFYGGTGSDKAEVGAGDFQSSIEVDLLP